MNPDTLELDRLRRELALRDADLAFHRHGQAALQAIAEAIADAPSVEQVLVRMLRALGELTGHANLALRLYLPECNCFKLVAQIGMTPDMVAELACLPADWGMMAEIVREKKPVFTSDMPGEPGRVGISPAAAGYRSLASVPLLAADRLVGTMEFATTDHHEWAETELQWLALLGRIVGANVQQIQLIQRLHDLAAAQERARLAQEMHDGMGQIIGQIHVWAEEAQLALLESATVSALTAVGKIQAAAQDAYDALRETILGLRTAIAPGESIIPVLRKFMDRFQRQWNIEAELVVADGTGNGTFRISPAQEIQLLRIVQEALANVRHHARASRVVVTITDQLTDRVVTIEDNGVGFDLNAVGEERLGLRIMRERAASVGGDVTVTSHMGRGTTLTIGFPKVAACPPEENGYVSDALGG